MNRVLFLKMTRLCICTMVFMLLVPALTFASIWVPNNQFSYDPVTSRVYGTVYSDQPQVSVSFTDNDHWPSVNFGNFSASRTVYGLNQLKVFEFNLDTVVQGVYDPSYFSISDNGRYLLSQNANLFKNYFGNVTSQTYLYSNPSTGIFKDFSLDLPSTTYTGPNNTPNLLWIHGSAAWGNPFTQGSNNTGGADLSSCDITSSNPDVATISSNLYTKYLNVFEAGSATITAVCGELTRSKIVTINPGYYKSFYTSYLSTMNSGSTYYFNVGMYDANNNSFDVKPYAKYSLTNPSVLSINPATGQVTTRSVGYTVITTTYGGFTKQDPVYVVGAYDSSISSLSFSSDSVNAGSQGLIAGTMFSPKVYASYYNWNTGVTTITDITKQATFQLADMTMGQVNPDQSLLLKKPGNTSLIAFFGGQYQTMPFKILPPTFSIAADSSIYSLTVGGTHQTVIKGVYSDGTGMDITNDSTYKSSNIGVATVSSTGKVTAVGVGTAVISATYGIYSASATVQVLDAPDTLPPTWASHPLLAVSDVDQTSAKLTWTSAEDNVGVTGYTIFQRGNQDTNIASLGNQLSYNLTGLIPNTSYTYSLKAVDASGNWSEYGSSLTFQTLSVPQDLDAPTWPKDSTLTSSNISSRGATLSWTAAEDHNGVTNYKLFSVSGSTYAEIGSTSNMLTYNLTGLMPNSTYTFTIKAGDASGNWSEYGPRTAITTRTEGSSGGGGGGGGSGGANQKLATLDTTETGNILISDAVKEAISNGVVIVELDTTKLAAIVANASSNSKVYTIKVRNSGDIVKVEITPDALSMLTKQNPLAVLQIKTEAGDYQLPLADVDVNSIAQQQGVDAKGVNIIVGIEKVQGNKAAELTAAASQMGAHLLSSPVEFTVTFVTNGSQVQEVSSFNHYVSRTLHLAQEPKSKTSIGVWFNPESKTYIPVPTLFKGSEATLLRKGNSIYTVLDHQRSFSDVSTHWAKEDIELLASKLIVKGIDENSFAPDKSTTRAEFAALLVRSLALTEKVKKVYKDVDLTEWYSGSVSAAQEAELINGDEFGNFKPNDLITREQMVTMIARALKFVGNREITDTTVLNKFADRTNISDWSQEAVASLVQTGIVQGVSNELFAPQDHATRAQSTTMLKRMLQYLQFMN
ncbi:S-layer homology domain-containing protein [Paenibacillus sp. FSL H7-0331]|uniref:S-layer homology domain-containing protein n=1 Tax=Paenibacillus sp. FSL H7-0331 TaxID=1920421 RepID=UPI00096C6C9F|nr:S-layer homology domain-containing protein [Paenibacillus sp. FSL H7-0331]OMF08454.1 hypothetical protein BK127_29095 [Paenibacillus sp. FSL H7-0331]